MRAWALLFPLGVPARASTLFPYTTLFRSQRDDRCPPAARARLVLANARDRFVSVHDRHVEIHEHDVGRGFGSLDRGALGPRSEEHTAEIQSLQIPVCRLPR